MVTASKAKLREDMRRIKLVKQTEDHDRDTCTCEGCQYFHLFGTIIQNGIMYYVEKDWKKIPPEEWYRSFERFRRYREDKKVTIEQIKEELRRRKVPENKIKEALEQIMMDMVPHVVFTKTPQGVMREI